MRGPGPRCFLHVPKCAGSSVHEALRVALPDASFAERRFDRAIFCDFDDFDALAPEMRARIAVTDEEVDELAGCDVVSGHFTLPTLLRIAEPASIATVLLSRARLLSLYAYWRSEDFRGRGRPTLPTFMRARPPRPAAATEAHEAVTEIAAARESWGRAARQPSRFGLPGAIVRKAVLRAIRPYSAHQDGFNDASVRAVERLARSIEESDARLRELERKLERT